MNLALFDFDGTITFRDSFTAFVLFATPAPRIALGTLSLGPLLWRFRFGQVAATEVRRAMVMQAFRGRDENDLRAQGELFSRQRLPHMLRPHALERIAWHQQRGDQVVVVSASLDLYLAGFCRRMGLGLVSSRLEAKQNAFTGGYLGADCTGTVKALRVREGYSLETYAEVYAYGDTDEDRELLELGTHRFMRWRSL